MIPRIEIAPLFEGHSPGRDRTDAAIMAAAESSGFLTVTGIPGDALSPELRRTLLAIFSLPEAEKRKLYRWSTDPSRPNVYRGWFPLQAGHPTYKEGIDMGPDAAYGPERSRVNDCRRQAGRNRHSASAAGRGTSGTAGRSAT
jgi:isopenicillin N synthase-like dioxygenase